MRYFVFFFLIALSVPSFGQTIIHDENAEVRNVPVFSGIKVSGGIDVYLSQSEDYALAVSASDQKYRDGIKTEVNNGILIISYDGGNFRVNSNRKLRVYTSFKTLESLEALEVRHVGHREMPGRDDDIVELFRVGDVIGAVMRGDGEFLRLVRPGHHAHRRVEAHPFLHAGFFHPALDVIPQHGARRI